MFENKNDFIREFSDRIEKEYGVEDIKKSTPNQRFMVLATMARLAGSANYLATRKEVHRQQSKQVYYFSLEFLMGRVLTSNLMNIGIYDVAKEGLAELGFDINECEEMENDMGLGNGGLGRLAACFMDSLATDRYPAQGQTLRYRYGFFYQKFEDNYQIEEPDNWMGIGAPWEIRKPDEGCDVAFWGRLQENIVDGKKVIKHVDAEYVRAIPYDTAIPGAHTKVCNSLRLWSAEPSNRLPKHKDFKVFEREVNEICDTLYPDDSTYEGKVLRLKQQYFLCAAGVNSIFQRHLRHYDNLDNFADKNVMQINDTHPALLVAEMMRKLMDEFNYSWDDAWAITNKSLAYTNHTILAEALEKWPVDLLSSLLPRVYSIIEEINRIFCAELIAKNYSVDKITQMAIVADHQVKMAHLAIVGSFSVNGVAALHTDILVEKEMKDWADLYPNKFNNKTNGITQRRWFEYSNPQLALLLKEYIGCDFQTNPVEGFNKLLPLVKDPILQNRFEAVKLERKTILAKNIKEVEGIEVNPNSIFDIQVKRLHAYKRQLLNALHIMYVYNRLKTDETFKANYYPHTFIFGAKAAPSYHFAKKVIKLIRTIADKVNNDPEVSDLLKVVFVSNYSVSYAELIMPAADVSEQISTAGKEASGTGNMKFMMNGAITLGTMDGANVEIHDLVGAENIAIFGMTKDEVMRLQESNTYSSYSYYNSDYRLKFILDQLVNGFFSEVHPDEFRMIYETLLDHNDEYYLLKDFASYVSAHDRINEMYKNRAQWNEMCLVNIAKSGFFSSDRTIDEYARDIWKVEKLAI